MDIWERAALWNAVMWGVAIIGAAVVLKDTPHFFGVFVVLAGCAAGSSAVLRDCRRRSKSS
ncbi:hypothetical protein [[Eubacterium] cellulosolvens]